MKDKKGQISSEYLLLIGALFVVLLISVTFIADSQELTNAFSAARNGAIEGSALSSSAIYPEDSYKKYSDFSILLPYSVDILNITYTKMGFDNNYEREKIQFKVYATTDHEFSNNELDAIGDRINYNLRRSIAITFNSQSSTNKLYNPVFSPHYVFTTANVEWV